jgi:hypothetical protein
LQGFDEGGPQIFSHLRIPLGVAFPYKLAYRFRFRSSLAFGPRGYFLAGPFHRLPHSMAAGFVRVSKQENQREVYEESDSLLVKFHVFYYILLIRKK